MSPSVRRTLIALAVPAVAAVALVGCSSSDSGDSTASASPSLIGGTTECNETTITEAATTAAEAEQQKLVTLNGFQCADGWAVADATVGPSDGSTDGEIDVTMVFEAEGQFWIPKDRGDVCGTIDSSTASPAYPSDAQVPEAIWPAACLTN